MDLIKLHPKYKNIIFDLGAVLIYFNAREIIEDIFKADKIKPYELYDALKTNICLDWDRGLKSPEEVSELLADNFDKKKLIKFLREIPSYLKPLENGLELFRMIKNKGYKTYILSNIAKECHEKIKNYEYELED